MISFCINNPVKVAVGVIVVALFGAIALWQIPIQLTPEVNTPTISVWVRWPGASPHEVEHEIVHRLEEQLKDVKGVSRMTSWSYSSNGSVTMEFPVGTDLTQSMLELNSKLNQLRDFPEDAFEPVISSANLSDRPVCWFVLSPQVPDEDQIRAFAKKHPQLAEKCDPLLDSHKWDLLLYRLNQLVKEHEEFRELLPIADIRKMRRFVEEHIEGRLDRVQGVADAFIMGGQLEEMQVVVDPEQLAARNLTVEDLRRALTIRNKDTAGGVIWDGKRQYLVRTLGQFANLEHVKRTIVSKENDVTTYVEDVAEVKLGFKRPTNSYRRGGSELIGLGILAETGANVLEVVENVRGVMDELNSSRLNAMGLRISEVWSDADYIESAVGLVNQNIMLGSVLTFLVLLSFLRSARSTIVIAIAVPTSIVGTFLILRLLDRSLNVVSLAGLAFAVGMIVDNSVVVLENVYRHYQRGSNPVEAALKGTREVWGAVLASTLTTLAVFVPVLFNAEEAGQLFRDIALAISAAVGLSLIVAITVIPMAASRLLAKNASRDTTRRSNSNARPDGEAKRGLGQLFVTSILQVNSWLMHGWIRRVCFTLLCIGGSAYLSYSLLPEVEYLPNGNKGRIQAKLYTPPGYSVAETEAISYNVFDRLKKYWEVHPDSAKAKELDAPPLSDLLVLAKSGDIMVQVQTADPSKIREWLARLRELPKVVPGMTGSAHQLSLFPGSSRKIDVELTGPNMRTLIPFARRVQNEIRAAIPGAQTSTSPGLWIANPELHVIPKWEYAAELGMSVTELGYVVDALVDGAYAAEYAIDGEKIDLRIVGEDAYDARTQDLGSQTIATGDGQLVPLSQLADFRIASGPPAIHHLERRRGIVVELRPPEGVTLGQAIATIHRDVINPMDGAELVANGLNIKMGGTADRLQEAWRAMRFNLLLGLTITYLLMAGLFESWLYPFVIIITVPLAAVGGVACLWLTNQFVDQPLDIVTMLGFVILIGTSVNNAILIVHQSINHLRDDLLSPREAVLESVRNRIRPIFMTTGTTVLGLFPLVVMPGAGSELYRGLGSVVLGGLVVSTMLTLVLVTCVFTLLMDLRSKLGRGSRSVSDGATLEDGNEDASGMPNNMQSGAPAAELAS